MRTIIKTYAHIFMAAIVATSCADHSHDVTIHRLDTELPLGYMPQDSVDIRGGEKLFEICGYGQFNPIIVGDYAENRSIRYHHDAVVEEFPDLSRESNELEKIFTRAGKELPAIGKPTVYSFISPFTQSILVTDSMLFIGLNHYMGPGYEPYEAFPEYVRKLKTRDRLPVDAIEALIRSTYPFRPKNAETATTVERLAYEGAVAEAIMRIADVSEATALGKDSKEMDWLTDNERNVWNAMLEKEMLFSTDGFMLRNICDDAPHASAINPEAPGRTGRFIGHRIVESYLKSHPETTLEQLLSREFYSSPELLKEAKYNP